MARPCESVLREEDLDIQGDMSLPPDFGPGLSGLRGLSVYPLTRVLPKAVSFQAKACWELYL